MSIYINLIRETVVITTPPAKTTVTRPGPIGVGTIATVLYICKSPPPAIDENPLFEIFEEILVLRDLWEVSLKKSEFSLYNLTNISKITKKKKVGDNILYSIITNEFAIYKSISALWDKKSGFPEKLLTTISEKNIMYKFNPKKKILTNCIK